MTTTDDDVLDGLFGGPNPYNALKELLKKPVRIQRHLLRLNVWCEWDKCTPVRVFELREGLLVQCRSDAPTGNLIETRPHLGKFSKRGAFFASEWMEQPGESADMPRLQVVCDCNQTPRLIDVGAFLSRVPAAGGPTVNLTVGDVSG